MTSPAEPVLPAERASTWFSDQRGIDRSLKVSWHPEPRLLVLSVWTGDTCTTTFRLDVREVPRLTALLVDGLGRAAGGVRSTIVDRAARSAPWRRRGEVT